MGHPFLFILGGFLLPTLFSGYSEAAHEPTAILQPDWPQMYIGEMVTLRCEIQEEEGTQWTYEWRSTNSKPLTTGEIRIDHVSTSHSGNYSCRGQRDTFNHSEWSENVTLTVSGSFSSIEERSVLTSSPPWLIPGAPVTLSCEVKYPFAGWRYYWYEASPNTQYGFELLPGSSDGTEESTYIIHGQKHTTYYMCRAGRGEPVYYLPYSRQYVWSADPYPGASLTLTPNKAQHFSNQPVTVSCEGNFTACTLRVINNLDVSKTITATTDGSSCTVNAVLSSGVHVCEFDKGVYSNAVNITVQNDNITIILESPALPVTEGDCFTMSCRMKDQGLLPDAFFYHNDKRLLNVSREGLNICDVSKSDEGFYWCEYLEQTSPQSWLSVRGDEDMDVE